MKPWEVMELNRPQMAYMYACKLKETEEEKARAATAAAQNPKLI